MKTGLSAPAAQSRPATTAGDQDEAAKLYDECLIVDCLSGGVLTPRVVRGLRAARIAAINLTAVGIGRDFLGALQDLAAAAEAVSRHADDLVMAREPADIHRAKAEGRTAIILGMQDAEAIDRDLSRLRTLFELGVRIIQLTHNRQNYIGTGCAEPDSGLTRFGREVVAEMNRLGILVDLSHCGPRTTLDAIECSAVPTICSHSNPKAVSPSPRNKDDETIRRLAARGGVMGIAAWSPIVYRGDGRRPTLDDVLDCFDHACGVAGPAHVALGTDFCEDLVAAEDWPAVYGPNGPYPEITGGLGDWYGFETVNAAGFESVAELPALLRGLLARGHSAAAVKDMLGDNFLRVFAQARAA